VEERATGLPFAVVLEADGRKFGVVRRVESALVRARPTQFGYQFVLCLVPDAEEALVVEVG
jgi:hypothetical protein